MLLISAPISLSSEQLQSSWHTVQPLILRSRRRTCPSSAFPRGTSKAQGALGAQPVRWTDCEPIGGEEESSTLIYTHPRPDSLLPPGEQQAVVEEVQVDRLAG